MKIFAQFELKYPSSGNLNKEEAHIYASGYYIPQNLFDTFSIYYLIN